MNVDIKILNKVSGNNTLVYSKETTTEAG